MIFKGQWEQRMGSDYLIGTGCSVIKFLKLREMVVAQHCKVPLDLKWVIYLT